MSQLNFDANQYNPEQGQGQFSVGKHLVIIEKDEIKKAKGSDGGYLQLDLKGVGQSEGERGPYRLNLFNNGANAAATVDAAYRQLSAVCHAVGVPGMNGDTSVIWNLPFMIEVGYQRGHNPATDGSDAKGYTEVKRVLYADGTDIKPGQFGAAGGQSQGNNGGFGNQQNQQQNNGGGFNNQNQQQNNNQGSGFNQQNQQQQQQSNDQGNNQQQQNQNNGGQWQPNTGGNQNQNQQQNNNQQQGNNNAGGGQWQPGQGQQNQGQQWQPRQN